MGNEILSYYNKHDKPCYLGDLLSETRSKHTGELGKVLSENSNKYEEYYKKMEFSLILDRIEELSGNDVSDKSHIDKISNKTKSLMKFLTKWSKLSNMLKKGGDNFCMKTLDDALNSGELSNEGYEFCKEMWKKYNIMVLADPEILDYFSDFMGSVYNGNSLGNFSIVRSWKSVNEWPGRIKHEGIHGKQGGILKWIPSFSSLLSRKSQLKGLVPRLMDYATDNNLSDWETYLNEYKDNPIDDVVPFGFMKMIEKDNRFKAIKEHLYVDIEEKENNLNIYHENILIFSKLKDIIYYVNSLLSVYENKIEYIDFFKSIEDTANSFHDKFGGFNFFEHIDDNFLDDLKGLESNFNDFIKENGIDGDGKIHNNSKIELEFDQSIIKLWKIYNDELHDLNKMKELDAKHNEEKDWHQFITFGEIDGYKYKNTPEKRQTNFQSETSFRKEVALDHFITHYGSKKANYKKGTELYIKYKDEIDPVIKEYVDSTEPEIIRKGKLKSNMKEIFNHVNSYEFFFKEFSDKIDLSLNGFIKNDGQDDIKLNDLQNNIKNLFIEINKSRLNTKVLDEIDIIICEYAECIKNKKSENEGRQNLKMKLAKIFSQINKKKITPDFDQIKIDDEDTLKRNLSNSLDTIKKEYDNLSNNLSDDGN